MFRKHALTQRERVECNSVYNHTSVLTKSGDRGVEVRFVDHDLLITIVYYAFVVEINFGQFKG